MLISGVVSASSAVAQDAGDSTIEEIIVTAQKREKGLIDTPVAVSALGAETLEQTGIRDLRDLQVLVPSYNVTTSQSAFQSVASIRGVGSSGQNPGIEPSVGIYVDGVFRSRTGGAMGDFISVERVEVLRGPQSTLFGKNTSAGVISIITQKPQFEAGGKAEITYGNYDQKILKGTFTGPLSDKVAVRVSGNLNKRDGFLTNLPDGRDVNDRDRWAIRGQMLFEANEDVSFRLIADLSEADEQCCAGAYFVNGPPSFAILALGGTVFGTPGGAALPFNREIAINSELRGDNKHYGFSGELNWDFGAATFTSITAYRDFMTDTELDADFTDLDVISRNGDLTKVETFTQEFRITSNGANKLDWLVGGYYFNQDLSADGKVVYGADTRAYFDILSGFVAPGVSNLDGLEMGLGLPAGTFFADGAGMNREVFTNDAKSWALFGQFDFHINERTTLTAGLRYTKEDKNGTGTFTNTDVFSGLDLKAISLFLSGGATDALLDDFAPLQFLKPVQDFDRDRSENKFTGNIILTYEANDDLSTYASYSRGYKAGGFDISRAASTVTGISPDFEFEDETVNNMEVGLKARILDGRGRVNVALYRQNVKDFQTVLFIGTGFELRNAGDIKLKGIEIDSEFAVSDNFSFTMAAAYNDAKYGTFTGAPCPIGAPLPGGCDLSGERLNDAPKLTLSGTATLTQPINDTMTGFLRGEVYSRGGRFTDSDNDPNNYQGASFLLNVSFGIQADDGGWQLAFWGKNLTKDDYAQVIADGVAQPGSFFGYPNDPRTYGVTLRGSF